MFTSRQSAGLGDDVTLVASRWAKPQPFAVLNLAAAKAAMMPVLSAAPTLALVPPPSQTLSATLPPPAPVPTTILGLPPLILFGGAGILVLVFLFAGKKTALPVHKNPARRRNPSRVPRSERLKRAVDAYESFHWGDKPNKMLHKNVSKPPRVGVKLGKLVSVAYETHKNGERAVWEHEFGEEGGKRPDLVMDADNKRLHIVGGSYDVRPEGIID